MKKFLIVDDMQGWRNFNTAVVEELFEGEEISIDTAESAQEAYNKVVENHNDPYYAVLTDLQMEEDYAPKLAGEWLVEQIKTFPKFYNTKIIMISATYNIRHIADALGVDCIPKSAARVSIEPYIQFLK